MPPESSDVIPTGNSEPLVATKSGRAKKIYTRSDMQDQIALGKKLIVFESKVLDVTNWMNHHPGGALSLSHLVGKDATDYMIAFHPKEVINKQVPRFIVAEYKAPETKSKSKIEIENEKVSHKFKELVHKLESEGWHDTEYGYYQFLLLRYLFIFIASIFFCMYGPYMIGAVVGGLLMAATWQQVAFYCHDSGHSGVTHDRNIDYTVGTCLASFVGGLSMGWWKDSHNVHHIITNNPHHDPDIQHLPVFAADKIFMDSIFSTYHDRSMPFDFICKLIIPYQHHLYFLINGFARFLLYGLSWAFVIRGHKQEASKWRLLEFVGMATFLVWYSALTCQFNTVAESLVFVLVSHVAASILHLQINISHYAMDTSEIECDEHFAVKALRTTMDVDCPEWFDWFHGGLQFQIIHHLFPRIPRHNLRKLQPIVMEFAKDIGAEYQLYTFSKGTGMVVDHLKTIADHCALLLSTAGDELHLS
jgi:delta8-fatty-acid desaturase